VTDAEVLGCPQVLTHPSRNGLRRSATPLFVLEFFPEHVLPGLPRQVQHNAVLQGLQARGWVQASALWDQGSLPTDRASLSLRMTKQGHLVIENSNEQIYEGPAGITDAWQAATLAAGEVVVLAGVDLQMNKPGWEARLSHYADSRQLFGTTAAATIPAGVPARTLSVRDLGLGDLRTYLTSPPAAGQELIPGSSALTRSDAESIAERFNATLRGNRDVVDLSGYCLEAFASEEGWAVVWRRARGGRLP